MEAKMAVFKTKVFSRWARNEGLSDASLCKAVHEMIGGLYDAELGGGLFKKRIARPGQGKRGGFRTLVATNQGNLWFFVYGFAKNERSNIDTTEEAALKPLATTLLKMSQAALSKALNTGELIEVKCDA
jgi:hypothetical protein